MLAHPEHPGLFVVDHPLIQHKLTQMRTRSCSTAEFRRLLREITLLMGYEITRDLPLTATRIETPVAAMDAPVLAGRKPAVVPVLRAGLTMAEALLDLMPAARVGHIGLARDPKSHQPVQYLNVLPDPVARLFILTDPMLATGGSAAHACDLLLDHGVAPAQIRFLALVAAPEGVRAFAARHPEVPVYVAALDSHLDRDAYIVPGLGDAGDRLFGTG